MKSHHMTFTTIFTYVYHQHTIVFFPTLIKTPHIYENMTIFPRDSTKDTGWGNTEELRTAPREIFLAFLNMHRRTLLLHRPTKLFKSSHASLFDILPSDILADIGIWISVLKHRDKFKHVISCFKYMCNPLLSAIPHYIWTPYHNFSAFYWYKKVRYDWAHRRILARDDSYWTYY